MTLSKILKSLENIDLVGDIHEIFMITDEPKIPNYLCYPSKKFSKTYKLDDSFGQGFDYNSTKSKIKSVGECLERLCLYNIGDKPFVKSKYDPNDKLFVDPSIFYCYSSSQDKNKEQTLEKIRNSKFRWSKVKRLNSDEEKFIPAQLIYLDPIFDDEFPIRKERISTGAAFGKTGTEFAFEGGLMESLERDATMGAYITKRSIKRIYNLPKKLENMVDYLRRYQLDANIFDITTDLNVPSIMTIVLDKTGIGAAVNIGSRASTNYFDAIEKSILESIHCRRSSRLMKKFQFPSKLPSENEIDCMDNRFYYWYSKNRIKDLDFWLNTSEKIDYKKLIRKNIDLNSTINNLVKENYNIFVGDLSLPQIKDEGFETIKVIIPELHPLYLDENAKSLYSNHYGEILEDKGLKPHPLT